MFNFEIKNLKQDPFFYIVSDELFDRNFYADLANDFPEVSKEQISNEKFQGGRVRSTGKTSLYKSAVDNSLSWRKFDDSLTLESLNKLATDIFGEVYTSKFKFSNIPDFTFKRKIKFLVKKILRKPLYSIFMSLSCSGVGYFNEPHFDRTKRVAVMLIFFCDANKEGMNGGEFVIQKLRKTPQNKSILSNTNRWFAQSECIPVESIAPQNNLGIFFINNEKSIHSVNKIKSIEGLRKFAYLALDFSF